LSCTIITTDAVGELAEIHDRMPLILREDDWDAWLNPDAALDPELLAQTQTCAASSCVRSPRWSIACAITGPNCSNRQSRSPNRSRCFRAFEHARQCRLVDTFSLPLGNVREHPVRRPTCD